MNHDWLDFFSLLYMFLTSIDEDEILLAKFNFHYSPGLHLLELQYLQLEYLPVYYESK